MDNNFSFSDMRDFFTTTCNQVLKNVEEYVLYLSKGEITLPSVFLLFLAFVVLWLFFKLIKSKAHKNTTEKKDLIESDTRLDRIVPSENVSEDIDMEKNNINTVASNSFDWSKENKLPKKSGAIKEGDLQYKLKPYRLQEMLGLMIDLLSRGIEDAKLAQVIMYKNQHLNTEDDIIYTIAALKLFIKMCKNGAFKNISSDKLLPNENVALFNLAKGDCSLVLLLLEAYIDDALDNIKRAGADSERRRQISELANVSLCFGTLAMLENFDLASGAFELAVELNPQNIMAWSRLGDAYKKAEKDDKAVWAYMNVLNSDDEGGYNQQVANASKSLYSYYKEKGKKEQAAKMLEDSSAYYEKIGINYPLSEREVMIIGIIESNEENSLEDIIDNLLDKNNN